MCSLAQNQCSAPHYTSKQVHEALEILQGYAIQKGDDGEGRKAIDAYRRYFSYKLMQAPRQTYLTDLFVKQGAVADEAAVRHKFRSWF